MLRLTFLSILVFSGLYFLTGKPSPSVENSIAQVSFEDTLTTSFAAHDNTAPNTLTQIDISAFKNSLGSVRDLLNTSYQKTKSYISSKYHATISQRVASKTVPAPRLEPTSLHATAASVTVASKPKTTAQTRPHTQKAYARDNQVQDNKDTQKRTSSKFARHIVTRPPLPMARPDRHTIAKMQKQEQEENKAKRVIASFRNFVANKKSPSTHKKTHKNLAIASTSQTNQTQRKLVNYNPSANQSKKLSPRFLTSMIKRQLKRLNCFGGAITPVWNKHVQRRIKSLDGSLPSNVPTQQALTYLENKNTLRCPKLRQPTVTTAKAGQSVHMFKANLSSNKVPSPKIVVRDRSGNIISEDGKRKVSAKLTNDDLNSDFTKTGNASDFATIEKGTTNEKDKDFDFTTMASNLLTPAKRRLPPSTVGTRSSRHHYQQYDLFAPVTKRKPKKRKPRYRTRKAKNWKSDVFND